MNPAHLSKDFFHCMREVSKGCHSVLEPGCQFGEQFRYIERPVMVGIEVHEPYLLKAWKDRRVSYIQGDAREALPKMASSSFDGVMMIDFLEHLERPDAERLLKEAERIARKRVWLWLPEGNHPQDKDEWGMGADYWQTHRSTWEARDLENLGYDVAVWNGHHKLKIGPTISGNAMFAVQDLPPGSPSNA